jgi:hypothetical protein
MSGTQSAEPIVSPEKMRQEAKRILGEARPDHLTLRLLGALAFEYQCPKFNHLRVAMGRVLSDLDLVSLSDQWQQVTEYLDSLGYSFDERYAMLHGNERLIFFHDDGFRVDVFFDRLDMCHVVDFRGRLEIDPTTISITDLLLEKLQIVRITRKDLIDAIILLREHEVGEDEKGVNSAYVAARLSGDWGFYYTATENLKFIRDQSMNEFDTLTEEDWNAIRLRIDRLRERIEAEPKKPAWRLRSKIGTKVQWYKDVGDLMR